MSFVGHGAAEGRHRAGRRTEAACGEVRLTYRAGREPSPEQVTRLLLSLRDEAAAETAWLQAREEGATS